MLSRPWCALPKVIGCGVAVVHFANKISQSCSVEESVRFTNHLTPFQKNNLAERVIFATKNARSMNKVDGIRNR